MQYMKLSTDPQRAELIGINRDEFLLKAHENEPRLAVPSCHGRR